MLRAIRRHQKEMIEAKKANTNRPKRKRNVRREHAAGINYREQMSAAN